MLYSSCIMYTSCPTLFTSSFLCLQILNRSNHHLLCKIFVLFSLFKFLFFYNIFRYNAISRELNNRILTNCHRLHSQSIYFSLLIIYYLWCMVHIAYSIMFRLLVLHLLVHVHVHHHNHNHDALDLLY